MPDPCAGEFAGSAETDAAGRYQVEGVPGAGFFYVVAYKLGYDADEELPPWGEHKLGNVVSLNFHLRPDPASDVHFGRSRVTVCVHDVSGNPVSDVLIQASDARPYQSGSQGRGVVRGWEAGKTSQETSS